MTDIEKITQCLEKVTAGVRPADLDELFTALSKARPFAGEADGSICEQDWKAAEWAAKRFSDGWRAARMFLRP